MGSHLREQQQQQQRSPSRSQRRAEKRKRAEAAEAAGVFRQPPGLRLRADAGLQDHSQFDFMFKDPPAAPAAAATAQQQQQWSYMQLLQPPPQQQDLAAGVAAAAGGVGPPGSRSRPLSAEAAAAAFFRARAADSNPFWESAVEGDEDGVLGIVTLQPAAAGQGARQAAAAASSAMVSCELQVVLSPQQLLAVQGGAFVQLWCFKVGDAVPCRVHWPYTNQQLLVNEAPVKPSMAKRLKLGRLEPHQGDLPADITPLVQRSAAVPANRLARISRLTVRLTAQVPPSTPAGRAGSGGAPSGFVLGCRLVRPRSVREVKVLLRPAPGLAQAVRQLQQKLASDDDDIIAEATSVSIRCAASCVPMQTPANFGTGEGLVCFDLDNFLEMTQKSGKWQCPGTRNFHSWRQLQMSPWMAAVLGSLEEAGLKQTVTDIEVAPDAKWRPSGAPRDCWFDVLQPPTAQQLRDSLKQGAAAATAAGGAAAAVGGVLADSDEERPAGGNNGAAKSAKQQPQKETMDLTLTDSEDEQEQQQQRRPPSAATTAAAGAGAAAGRLAGRALAARPPGSGSGGRAAAAAGAGNQQQQGLQQQWSVGAAGGLHGAHRHGYLPKVSEADWRRQQEVVRHAQEQQLQRLVRQGSIGALQPRSFLAMMQDSGDSTPPAPAPPPPPPAAAAAAAGQRRTQPRGGLDAVADAAAAAAAAERGTAAGRPNHGGSGGVGRRGGGGGSGDEEPYDPLAEYGGRSYGRGLSDVGDSLEGGGSWGGSTQDAADSCGNAGLWDGFPTGYHSPRTGRAGPPLRGAGGDLEGLYRRWQGRPAVGAPDSGVQGRGQQQQREQQWQRQPPLVRGMGPLGVRARAPAALPVPAEEPEVIDLVSDSD